jgi:cytochrome c oxidase subunit 2
MLGSMNIVPSMNIFNSLATADWGSFWLPPQASTVAPDVDWLFYFIYWICVFFFLLILVLLVGFAWKYRYREGHDPGEAPKHNTALELTWTFIPTVIVVIIFVYGFKGFMRMNVAPPNTYEIVVQARMWHYNFQYPNGWIDDELHIPKDVPVRFVLNSADVIHGFYIPDFRVKKDIVPGRYNSIWIEASILSPPEGYNVFCTQFCGDQHSMMRAKAFVQPVAEYKTWLDSQWGKLPPAELGKKYYTMYGCIQCHTIDGNRGTGPTWKDLYGSMVPLKDGTQQKADEDYLHYMIMINPNIGQPRQVMGFEPKMSPTAGLVTDKSADALITYIKTLSVNYHPELPTTTTAPSGAESATKPAATRP